MKFRQEFEPMLGSRAAILIDSLEKYKASPDADMQEILRQSKAIVELGYNPESEEQ